MNSSHLPQLAQQQQLLVQATSATHSKIKGDLKMKNIAVRLWNNEMFGKTYGKGKRKNAFYNGTVEISIPPVKYLIDLETITSWYHNAKYPIHLKMLDKIEPYDDANVLMSWIVRYESGVKTPVYGYCCFDISKLQLLIKIDDPEYRINETWELAVKECLNRTPGKPTPSLIATNHDLKLAA
jgi:hypothetical protein